MFIISPFRKVSEAVARTLQRGIEGVSPEHLALIDSGTVHTFQGKEADVVILVLGSATGEKGVRSRTWASAKPNLLNVAVTRANSAIYVIGNWADWSSCRGFDDLARRLEPIPLAAYGPDALRRHGSVRVDVVAK